MGKFSKRNKSFYVAARKKQKVDIIVGTVGYLGTCNSYEDRAVREGYDLLNRYANQIYGEEDIKRSTTKPEDAATKPEDATTKPEEATTGSETATADASDEDELDLEAALKKEVSSLQAADKPGSGAHNRPARRFQVVRCTTSNNLFFRSTLSDPLPTLIMAMDDILSTKQQQTKYLVRLLPVHTICRAYHDNIEKAFGTFVTERLKGKQKTFYLNIRITSNNSMKKDELLGIALKVLQELAPECKPVLTKDADIAINITVLVQNCYIGEAPLFLSKYKRYNLMELASPDPETVVVNKEEKNSDTSASSASGIVQHSNTSDLLKNKDELVSASVDQNDSNVQCTESSVSEKDCSETTQQNVEAVQDEVHDTNDSTDVNPGSS
uniref:THUMP domain-containing protein 1-like n=2 Tax=Hirondellea gigas TaxID=1518452 RepID=A0A6A7FTZ8_9CRUS